MIRKYLRLWLSDSVVLAYCLSMISSENRRPPIGSLPEGMLFRIMLQEQDLAQLIASSHVIAVHLDHGTQRAAAIGGGHDQLQFKRATSSWNGYGRHAYCAHEKRRRHLPRMQRRLPQDRAGL